MRVAIVHELLTMRGGAERVCKIFAEMFPEAPVYTLLYDEKKLGDWFPSERVRVSRVQSIANRLPLNANRSLNHHWYLKKFPAAAEAWDFSEFDLVISSSSAFAHGIITNGKPKHLSYIHSPARYLWDRTHDVAKNMSPLMRPLFKRAAHNLRIWDSEAAYRADALIAPSKEVQRRIELYWRRESDVIHPPIDDFWFDTAMSYETRDMSTQSSKLKAQSYFLVVSTLARYKRIDLTILAANALKVPLIIAGEGSDRRRLQKLAGPTVTFSGYVGKAALRDLYENAIATIFPGEEDFGLVPLESMACGTPVIAFNKGGARETITHETGTFFDQPTAESLMQTMNGFDSGKFNPQTLHEHATKFSRKTFEEKIRSKIESL